MKAVDWTVRAIVALAAFGLVAGEVQRVRALRHAVKPVLTIVEPVPLWGVPACHRMAAGVNADHIHTKSLGRDKPVDPGHDEHAWSQNRRGEFILVLPK